MRARAAGCRAHIARRLERTQEYHAPGVLAVHGIFGVVGPKRVGLSRTRRDIADGLIPSRYVATKTRLIRGHDKITQTA